MNFRKFRVALSCFFYSIFSFAGSNNIVIISGGTVHMKGSLLAPACVVSANSNNLTIDMGQLRSNQFSGEGSYAPATPFSIKLSECDKSISQKVGVTFWGSSESKDSNILRINEDIDSAKGVGISLFDKDNNILTINKKNNKLQFLRDNENILYFTARYRATKPHVIGGKANSVAWFTLTYE